MSNIGRFAKSSATYFAGSVLTKIISFFLLPIYTNFIETADMSYYDNSFNYLSILIPVISLEIWSGIMRYMYDMNDQKQKMKPIVNGLCIFSISAILYSIIFIVIAFSVNIAFLPWIFLYGFLTMLHSIYSYIARGLGLNKTYAISGIIGSLVGSISNIILILGFRLTLLSLYISIVLGITVQLIIMESKVHLLTRFKREYIDKQMIKSMIRFSLPLCINSACYWFLSSYNRIAIENIMGADANGLYGVAIRLSAVLTLVSSCFSMAWQELAFSKGNKNDNSQFYTTATNYYIQLLMLGILIFMPVIQVIFPYFIGPNYHEAFAYIPLYLLATAASIISGFFGSIYAAEKKTGIIFFSTLVAAVINVSILHLLIPSLGLQAANISLLLGFTVNIAIRVVLLKKTAKIKIDFIFLFLSFFLFAIGFYIYLKLSIGWNILFGLLVAVIGLVFFKDLIKDIIDRTRQSLKTRFKK
ncbi:polysaccharide biosynthesis C-terminal domain-containing protein [Paludicola sp. MB14-C6]|uniref:lipopolysaccharide biosynthesis protein n=1 Tax=Paludihabitans sp. MB14-C6 TaxID=3070656 RepID=UPI0027DAD3E2|nr:polysaccharide biosynthesis C-terminal domain-containing protein [Paludicola sp. MB14-C6]WMJ21952.1 polysaccharide biosynthesis C-terminal domain-containing protein [Paludicola sp. MB14-C6]